MNKGIILQGCWGLAGLKLVIAIVVVLVLIVMLVFGKPFTGFSVLSFIGLDSDMSSSKNVEPTGKAALDEILAENPELNEKMIPSYRQKFEQIVADNPAYSKEVLEEAIRNALLTTPEEEEALKKDIEEQLKKGLPTIPEGEEVVFIIGGKEYTEVDIRNLSEEENKRLAEQWVEEGMKTKR